MTHTALDTYTLLKAGTYANYARQVLQREITGLQLDKVTTPLGMTTSVVEEYTGYIYPKYLGDLQIEVKHVVGRDEYISISLQNMDYGTEGIEQEVNANLEEVEAAIQAVLEYYHGELELMRELSLED